MEIRLKYLSRKIERVRMILYKLMSKKQLTDATVVHCSHKLDNLLNEYEKCRKAYYGDAA